MQPADLPSPLTSFIGRDAELARLAEIVSSGARVVTLFGPAGIGKTRLALRYAQVQGGASFCDLTTANGLVDLCDVVARTLGIALGPTTTAEGLLDRVGTSLATQANSLVVLDNCEHIVEHAALALARWARAAPSTCFLATSRELLGIVGEQAYEVPPLRLPSSPHDQEAEAVRLFDDRCRLVRQDRRVSPEDPDAIAALVRQLDGLPLAIELAAGCTDIFTPRELLRGASGHLDELESRARTPAERHRTLRAAISGSWELLGPWEQAALAQCTVFRGGFSLESARAVTDLSAYGEAPSLAQVLGSLRAKSLLRVVQTGMPRPETRFGLYESIRTLPPRSSPSRIRSRPRQRVIRCISSTSLRKPSVRAPRGRPSEISCSRRSSTISSRLRKGRSRAPLLG